MGPLVPALTARKDHPVSDRHWRTTLFYVGPIVNAGIFGSWNRDGSRFAFTGAEEGKPPRAYVVDLVSGGTARPVTPEGSQIPYHA